MYSIRNQIQVRQIHGFTLKLISQKSRKNYKKWSQGICDVKQTKVTI